MNVCQYRPYLSKYEKISRKLPKRYKEKNTYSKNNISNKNFSNRTSKSLVSWNVFSCAQNSVVLSKALTFKVHETTGFNVNSVNLSHITEIKYKTYLIFNYIIIC